MQNAKKKRNDIKDCTHYFLDDMIKIKNVDPNKIKIVKNSYKWFLFSYLHWRK